MHILPLSATEIENRLKSLPENAVVHEYSPDSEYPLSGKAVAEALASLYTHYAGTLIDKTNYSGVDYLDQIFKKDDIYINDSENNIYQCVSSELNEDGSYHSVWRIITAVDQVYDSNSENAQSGKAVANAISSVKNLIGDTSVADQIQNAISILDFYTKSEINNMGFITIANIDAICGASVVSEDEVML